MGVIDVSVQSKRPGFDLSRLIWKTANRVRTGYARCVDILYKCGKLPFAVDDCGIHVKPQPILSNTAQIEYERVIE